MNAEELIEAIREAGAEPFSYSGRGMFGDVCVALAVDDAGVLLLLGARIAAAEMRRHGAGRAEWLSKTRSDTHGRGVVVYWPDAAWPID